MVLKPSSSPSGSSSPFENDVKMYGTQTIEQAMSVCLVFENDVKMYGTQTKDD